MRLDAVWVTPDFLTSFSTFSLRVRVGFAPAFHLAGLVWEVPDGDCQEN